MYLVNAMQESRTYFLLTQSQEAGKLHSILSNSSMVAKLVFQPYKKSLFQLIACNRSHCPSQFTPGWWIADRQLKKHTSTTTLLAESSKQEEVLSPHCSSKEIKIIALVMDHLYLPMANWEQLHSLANHRFLLSQLKMAVIAPNLRVFIQQLLSTEQCSRIFISNSINAKLYFLQSNICC